MLTLSFSSFLDDKLTLNTSFQKEIHDALRVFQTVAAHDGFSRSPIVLFLNKKDIFQIKLKKVPLTVAFPDYQGWSPDLGFGLNFSGTKLICGNVPIKLFEFIFCPIVFERIKVVMHRIFKKLFLLDCQTLALK